jgi:hypothetical protein
LGAQPLWRGNEIFFWGLQRDLWAAEGHPVGTGLQVGTPRKLFSLPSGAFLSRLRHEYDITRDGKRFLVNSDIQAQTTTPITLVINWPEELKK